MTSSMMLKFSIAKLAHGFADVEWYAGLGHLPISKDQPRSQIRNQIAIVKQLNEKPWSVAFAQISPLLAPQLLPTSGFLGARADQLVELPQLFSYSFHFLSFRQRE